MVVGVAVAIALGPVGLGVAAWYIGGAVGGAVTTSLALASGVGWRQALGEGLVAGSIVGGIGKIVDYYQHSAKASAPSNSNPTQPESGNEPPSQEKEFPDKSSHKSIDEALPESTYNWQNSMPSLMSDRGNGFSVGSTEASLFGGNFGNGAKSEASAEIYGFPRSKESLLSVDEGQGIVNEAASWAGTPYAPANTRYSGRYAEHKLGGDCSGITNAAYVARGYNYPHMQVSRFAETSGGGHFAKVSSPQSGDVALWYDKSKDVHHMGIYSGKNQMWTTHINSNDGQYGFGRIDRFNKDFGQNPVYYRYQK